MLALAQLLGISLVNLEAARRRLAAHERDYDGSFGATRRAELARAMNAEVEILAAAYKQLAAAVERMPSG